MPSSSTRPSISSAGRWARHRRSPPGSQEQGEPDEKRYRTEHGGRDQQGGLVRGVEHGRRLRLRGQDPHALRHVAGQAGDETARAGAQAGPPKHRADTPPEAAGVGQLTLAHQRVDRGDEVPPLRPVGHLGPRGVECPAGESGGRPRCPAGRRGGPEGAARCPSTPSRQLRAVRVSAGFAQRGFGATGDPGGAASPRPAADADLVAVGIVERHLAHAVAVRLAGRRFDPARRGRRRRP